MKQYVATFLEISEDVLAIRKDALANNLLTNKKDVYSFMVQFHAGAINNINSEHHV